jgi:hypothetical protein
LIALIWYQECPDTTFPWQVVRQSPPRTVAATETRVVETMAVRTGADIELLVRRFTPHTAVLETVAPKTSVGDDAATPNRNIEAMTEAATTNVSDERRADRTTGNMTDTSRGWNPSFTPDRTSSYDPLGPVLPGPQGWEA